MTVNLLKTLLQPSNVTSVAGNLYRLELTKKISIFEQKMKDRSLMLEMLRWAFILLIFTGQLNT